MLHRSQCGDSMPWSLSPSRCGSGCEYLPGFPNFPAVLGIKVYQSYGSLGTIPAHEFSKPGAGPKKACVYNVERENRRMLTWSNSAKNIHHPKGSQTYGLPEKKRSDGIFRKLIFTSMSDTQKGSRTSIKEDRDMKANDDIGHGYKKRKTLHCPCGHTNPWVLMVTLKPLLYQGYGNPAETHFVLHKTWVLLALLRGLRACRIAPACAQVLLRQLLQRFSHGVWHN